jgi:hypothetical protein
MSVKYRKFKLILSGICGLWVCLGAILPQRLWAEDKETSFYPTWKLLTSEQKQQFIAGYIQGWKDAGRVTEISLGFIKDNPEKAVDALTRVRDLYFELTHTDIEALGREVDTFYGDPKNQAAGFSAALNSAKAQMRMAK